MVYLEEYLNDYALLKTMDPNTRRLVQLTLEAGDGTNEMMDMLLSKKRAPDRKVWLEAHGNEVDIL